MTNKFKLLLVIAYLISACQTSNTFDDLNVNTVDLTRITGEPRSTESFFDSAIWSAALSAAILAALSSSQSTYKKSNMDPNALDSEWIE